MFAVIECNYSIKKTVQHQIKVYKGLSGQMVAKKFMMLLGIKQNYDIRFKYFHFKTITIY